MGILSSGKPKSKFAAEQTVTKVKVPVQQAPRPKPKQQLTVPVANGKRAGSVASSSRANGTPRPSPKPRSSVVRLSSASPAPSSADERSSARKRKVGGSSRSPASPKYAEDSDSDEDNWANNLVAQKRQKQSHNINRELRHPHMWAGDDVNPREIRIIHASEIASLDTRCRPALGLDSDNVAIKLRYPGSKYPEQYELVIGKDIIDPIEDIKTTVKFVASNYLSDADAKVFLDPNTGVYRQLDRRANTKDGKGFKMAVKDYNDRLLALQKRGLIAAHLDVSHELEDRLVHFILKQSYDRTVAPKVELLRKYENGTDNVYGELNPPFVTSILVDRLKMTSDQVFVDLGSGVGNVVLQAALEIGCESWGCEMMENACKLADAQEAEFSARCRLWGVKPGKIRLEQGDFRKNKPILEILKRADVILVNNQAFTSGLNASLVTMFLDLKAGCKIVSLKSFVYDNTNAKNDIATQILDVEYLTYPEEWVSWTDKSGTYCISTKKT
ncbi:histone H3-K79 methyltransferase [Thozetella sp. PMI_491]|nr:histone H3-K79 methyltransferase [Thozetella sp. PMI_491]